MIKYILKGPAIMTALLLMLFITACKKDFPKNVDSPYGVVLQSIKIVNAGEARNTILNGVIDENAKTITFPKLDTLSNFSDLRFEATVSDGAKLEKTTYQLDFKQGAASFVDGKSSVSQIIKVINNARFREYAATFLLKIPPFGADFGKPQYYDYSNNAIGNPTYPDFTGLLTRWTGFDGNKVLIVSRAGGSAPHLLNVSDLRQNVINKTMLNLTGVTGGTYAYSSGAQINGHTYICNLATSAASALKIYHWTDPSKAPDVIGNIIPNTIPTLGARYGDNMSVSLDANGNGYMFFGDNNAGAVNIRDILRIKVTNYTTLSDPTSIPAQPGVTSWMTISNVTGTADYLLTGYAAPIYLVSESGTLSYTFSAVPTYGTDARIFSFNKERYLIMTGAARDANGATVFFVYDITKGATVKDALDNFNNKSDKTELFKFSLMGAANAAPGTQSGWHITKDAQGNDSKLTLFAATTDAGFVIIDVPKKTLDE